MRKISLLIILIITILLTITFIGAGCGGDSPVLYLGFMVHLEGWDEEVTDEDMFEHHADAARKLAAIFDEYGAKATFEARPEFISGCENWRDNVLLELHRRGHGIGVHADVGGAVEREGTTLQNFAISISEMRKNLDKLTGVKTLHVSGICSELDWVKATIDAGYKFVTGTIGYCAMSLPVDKRPDEYADCPNPGKCHGVIPAELKDRVHPWRASTGKNWLNHDPDGELVILTESGVLESLAESVMGESTTAGEFTQADIDVYLDMLEEALNYVETGKITFLYVGLSIGSPNINEDMYKRWFSAIQLYIDSGQAEWKTLPEIYLKYSTQGKNN